MNNLQSRCKRFMRELGVPMSKFCANIALSRSALTQWLNGDLRLAEATISRIDNYLTRYGF